MADVTATAAPDDIAQQFAVLAQGSPQGAAQVDDISRQFAELAKSPAIPLKNGAGYDPSAGGGTFRPLWLDTGIPTPQWLDRTLSGIGQGMYDLSRHAGNLVGLESNQNLVNAKALDAPLMDTAAGRVGSLIGQTALTAPAMGGATAGLARLGGLGARVAGNAIARGAVEGATQGGLTADPGQRLQGALAGGALGTTLPLGGATIGKVASGLSRTPAAQTLLDAGVSLTPGQMNPTGIANRMEQALEGTPVVGDLVQNARDAAQRQYARRMVEDAMAPGAKLPASAHDFNSMIDAAARSFDAAYDVGKGYRVTPAIVRKGASTPLSDALDQVVAKPRLGLTAAARADIGEQLQDQLSELGTGKLKSDDLLGFRSMIREASRDEAGDTAASRATIKLYKDAENQVTDAINSQLARLAPSRGRKP
jgi:hypothetical protein